MLILTLVCVVKSGKGNGFHGYGNQVITETFLIFWEKIFLSYDTSLSLSLSLSLPLSLSIYLSIYIPTRALSRSPFVFILFLIDTDNFRTVIYELLQEFY